MFPHFGGFMIEAISSSNLFSEFKSFSQNHFGLTDAKTNRIALSSFAVITFTIGIQAFSIGTLIANFIAVASIVASGALVWIVMKIKNYDDLVELCYYQNKAKSMTLPEIIKEHGWHNMMAYEIPISKDFKEKFRATIQQMQVTGAIRFYELVKEHIEKNNGPYQLLDPSELKEKFALEVKEMEATDIFESYDIDKLYEYGIANKDLKGAKDQYEKNLTTYKSAVKTVEEECVKKLRTALNTFQKVLEQTCGSNPTQVAWIEQLQRESQFLTQSNSNTWFNDSLKILKELPLEEGEKLEENLLSVVEAHKAFIKEVETAKKDKKTYLSTLEQALENRKEAINAPFRN
jgi:hypothetical protein